jgi:hypothetical protein
MKLGTTSIGLWMPSWCSVVVRSHEETAVAASLCTIPQRVVSM